MRQTPKGVMIAGSREQTLPASLQGSTFSSTYNSDERFRDEFEKLYAEVSNFVDAYFCQWEDIPPEHNLSPWIEMSSEFVRYSAVVAEPDDSLGDWNQILLKRKERWYLLVGILARILEVKVFGELLFGGSRGQKQQLEAMERSSIEAEGFGRTEDRANNVAAILGGRLTLDFHIDVTRLSKQIMMLLQPLSRFLESAAKHKDGITFSDEDQFRNIHGIVAMAAHLSVRTRLSPTIFYFHSERPSNLYDPEDQTDMDYPDYVASKSAATEVQNRLPDGKRRRVLVKFAIWPSIKRYSAGIGNRESETSGFRIYTISNSKVVYYWGLEDSQNRVSIDLETFIKVQRRQRRSIIANLAGDTVHRVGTILGRAMEQLGDYQVAVILVASAYLITRDFVQGKDPFGWQSGQ